MVLIPGLGRPLQDEMATHSSILAWKTAWREEEPGVHYVVCQESDMGRSLEYITWSAKSRTWGGAWGILRGLPRVGHE